MPVQGTMGPIMRKPDPQKTNLRNPVPQKDEKGVMILGRPSVRDRLHPFCRGAGHRSAVEEKVRARRQGMGSACRP
jgi:hypothetical protein